MWFSLPHWERNRRKAGPAERVVPAAQKRVSWGSAEDRTAGRRERSPLTLHNKRLSCWYLTAINREWENELRSVMELTDTVTTAHLSNHAHKLHDHNHSLRETWIQRNHIHLRKSCCVQFEFKTCSESITSFTRRTSDLPHRHSQDYCSTDQMKMFSYYPFYHFLICFLLYRGYYKTLNYNYDYPCWQMHSVRCSTAERLFSH